MSEESRNPQSLITRRDFLKGVAAGAVAAAIATVAIEELRPRPVKEVEVPVEPEVPVEYTKAITLTVNGEEHALEVRNNWTLLEVLRNELGLTGSKDGCDRGNCGACTVIADGRAVYACMMLAVEAEGKDIKTIEGLADETLDPIQQSFADHHALQCGYCTPGFIMSAKALLDEKPSPTTAEVKEALSGNICVCGEYRKIVEAVLAA